MKKCTLKANCKITSETIIDSISITDEFNERELDSCIHSFDTADHKITIFIAEKYFYRITSTLTITLIIDQTEEATTIEVISGGGKRSNSLGFALTSWGAEKSALNDVIVTLKQLGFAEVTK